MAKKRPTPEPDPLPPSASGRTGENLNVWVSSALVDALRAYVETQRPRTTKTATVELALEQFLEAKGFWPAHGARL